MLMEHLPSSLVSSTQYNTNYPDVIRENIQEESLDALDHVWCGKEIAEIFKQSI